MAVASLVLGILSLVAAILPFLPSWLGAVLGIIGIILGALARKDSEKAGMATAGMVLSIIGTVLCLIFWVACAACVGSLGSALS